MRTKTLVCYALSCTSTLSVVLMVLALFLYEEDFLSKFTEEDHFLTSLIKPDSTAIMFYTFETNPKDLDYNWERLEEAVRDDEKMNHISIKKIECTVFKPLCSKFEVENYPTIAWMQRGKIIEKFEGDQTSFKSLKSFVDRMSQEQAKTTEITTDTPTDVTEISMTDTETILPLESSNFDETTVQVTESPVVEEVKSTKHVHFAPEDPNLPRSSTDRMDPMYYHPKIFTKNQPSSSPIKFNPKFQKFSEENGKSFYRKDKGDFGKKAKSTPHGKKYEAPSSSSSSENTSKSSHQNKEHSSRESMSFEHSGSHSKSYYKKHPDSNVGKPYDRSSRSDSKSKSRSYETREEFSESSEKFSNSKSKSVESNEDNSKPIDSREEKSKSSSVEKGSNSKSSSAHSSSHPSGSDESAYKKDVITEILKKDKAERSLEKASKSSENISKIPKKETGKSIQKSQPKEVTKSLKESNEESTTKATTENPIIKSSARDSKAIKKSKPMSTEKSSKSSSQSVKKSLEKASKSKEVKKSFDKDETKTAEVKSTPPLTVKSSKKSIEKESNKKDFNSQDQKSLEKVKVESEEKQESTLKADFVKSSLKSIETKSKVSSQQSSDHSKIKSTIKNESPSRSVLLNKSGEPRGESKSTNRHAKISKPKSTNSKSSGLKDEKLEKPVKTSKNDSQPSLEKPDLKSSEKNTTEIPTDYEDSSEYDEDYFDGQTINFADLFKSVEDDKSDEKVDTSEEMEIVRYFPSTSSEQSSEEEEKEISDEKNSKEQPKLDAKTNLTEEAKNSESLQEKEIPKVVNQDTQDEKIINLEIKIKDEIPSTIKEAPKEEKLTTDKILVQDIPIQKDESKEKEVKVQYERTRHRNDKDRTQRIAQEKDLKIEKEETTTQPKIDVR